LIPLVRGKTSLAAIRPHFGERGNLVEAPFLALTQEALRNGIPLQSIVIAKQIDPPYLFSCWLGETDWVLRGYPTWGDYKGKTLGIKAYIYKGGTLKAVIQAADAKGQGQFWKIVEIDGSKLTIINKLENGFLW
jgi:hypothetical protein